MLNKSYQLEGVQRAPTKADLKKLVKIRERSSKRDLAKNAQNQEDDDEGDYDWSTLG